jgi:hypothetical protein
VEEALMRDANFERWKDGIELAIVHWLEKVQKTPYWVARDVAQDVVKKAKGLRAMHRRGLTSSQAALELASKLPQSDPVRNPWPKARPRKWTVEMHWPGYPNEYEVVTASTERGAERAALYASMRAATRTRRGRAARVVLYDDAGTKAEHMRRLRPMGDPRKRRRR